MDNSVRVDITPNKTLIQKLGLIGYRTDEAIAELIDNSIDARIDGVQETVDVVLNFKDGVITVMDDGMGMDKDDMKNAMTIAKGQKTDDKLGKFGIGMKSACSALGKHFVIMTSKKDSRKEYSVEYDEDEWLKDDSLDWRNFRIKEREIETGKEWHGTKIEISKLKVSLYPNQVTKFNNGFGIRYGPYILGGQIKLKINTIECKPQEPEIIDGSRRDVGIQFLDGSKIRGYVALLKKRSIKGYYGIHLFKNGRLIKAYEKFGFKPHPETARIMGRLDLDNVPVNFHKSAFIEDSFEYRAAETAFSNDPEVQKIIKESRSKTVISPPPESVFRYFTGESSAKHLDARISKKSARQLLDDAGVYAMKLEGRDVTVSFVDSTQDPLYDIEQNNDEMHVKISKNNVLFNYVQNPLVLIGLMAAEVELIAKNPAFYNNFVQRRNSQLFRFLSEWKEKQSSKKERVPPMPVSDKYDLSQDLKDIYAKLTQQYEHKFQFTALSTLSNYAHYAQQRKFYTIHTVPGAADYLTEVLTQIVPSNFVVLSNPKSADLELISNTGQYDRFILVREYKEIYGSTIATPEKAWVDLVNEIYTHKILVQGSELKHILQELVRLNIVDVKKILPMLVHHKKLDKVEKIIDQVQSR